MVSNEPLRIPFRTSVSSMLILITIPLILAIIGILYLRNAQLARDLANEAISRATANVDDHIDGLLSPMARVVEATAALGRIDRGALRRVNAFQYFLTVLESTPQAESVYVGFAPDGAFYQASRLSPSLQRFGPTGGRPPQNARLAIRILDTSSGEKADSFIYLARPGEVVAVERGPSRFDPRERPWYAAAWRKPGRCGRSGRRFRRPGAACTSVHARAWHLYHCAERFGRFLGISLVDDAIDGTAIGAVGIDISLSALSGFLARERIGEHGLVFIVDDKGNLIGYRGSKRSCVRRRAILCWRGRTKSMTSW